MFYWASVKSPDGESRAGVCHDREEATSVSANKIVKPKQVSLRPPTISGRKALVGGTCNQTEPHSVGKFAETEVPDERARQVTTSKRLLCTFRRHFNHINQLRYFPPSTDFRRAQKQEQFGDTTG